MTSSGAIVLKTLYPTLYARTKSQEALSAEAEAIHLALSMAKRFSWQAVSIECDSALAVKALSGDINSCPWSLLNIRVCCDELSNCFKDLDLAWIDRRSNFAAHNLAKWARLSLVFGDIPPSSIPSDFIKDGAEWSPG
ncbi:hypothetical protein L484_004079 [Morus notabilis]|uniref:RNase H type-1 domain-containing protein n=1 Tax=Morus notabilis TaxID=981085 RepID=W9QIA4_9ROSA|nr:hypothetical protein L484_004079 [Morus notabilis]